MNIDAAWDEIAYFQLGDVPGRKEPLTGEINFKNVFQHIWNKGYRGIIGMEHGQSDRTAAGDKKLLDAYRAVDVPVAGSRLFFPRNRPARRTILSNKQKLA